MDPCLYTRRSFLLVFQLFNLSEEHAEAFCYLHKSNSTGLVTLKFKMYLPIIRCLLYLLKYSSFGLDDKFKLRWLSNVVRRFSPI